MATATREAYGINASEINISYSGTISEEEINENKELLDSVQVELDKRQTEVESAEATYNSIKAEMTSLQEQLDMDKWFTKDEWKTLDTYVVEETYSNDNYSIADNCLILKNNYMMLHGRVYQRNADRNISINLLFLMFLPFHNSKDS